MHRYTLLFINLTLSFFPPTKDSIGHKEVAISAVDLNTYVGIMYKLRIEKDAQEDIRKLIAEGGKARADAVKIVAFLEELKGNSVWLNELLTRKFAHERFDVDRFLEYWNQGLDIWRLKVFEFVSARNRSFPLPLRVIYCYDQHSLAFRVLAVCKRDDFDYQPDHEQTKRICRLYDALGLPKHSTRRDGHSRN